MGNHEFNEAFLKGANFLSGLRGTLRRESRGSGGSWNERFTPPKSDEDTASIVLYPGKYVHVAEVEDSDKQVKILRQYYMSGRHFSGKTRKMAKCTAGLAVYTTKDGPVITAGSKPCTGCRAEESGEPVKMQMLHVFNLVKLGYFHLVDTDTKRKDGNGYYQEYQECTGKTCKKCDRGVERVYGRRMYWPMTPTQADQLFNYIVRKVSSRCICGTGLEFVGLECPECHTVYRDFEKDPPDSKKELTILRGADNLKCEKCGYTGLMEHMLECSNHNIKAPPRPLQLWEVVLDVYTSGELKSKTLHLDSSLLQLKKKALISKLMTPYDFAKVFDFRDISLKDQAEKLGTGAFLRSGEDTNDDYDEDFKSKSSYDDDDEKPKKRKRNRAIADIDEDDIAINLD